MTAPDQVAKTSLEPLASGGRPHMISASYCANAKGPFNGQRPERAFHIIYQIAIGNVEPLFEKQAIGIGQIYTVDRRARDCYARATGSSAGWSEYESGS